MFGSGSKLTFRDYVQGTWGSFTTPAGRVDYLMTKARLGDDSDDPERQLTKSLAPVREVMEAEDLDFNQLLQRDLDDHRVAIKLIPYLLKQQMTGPAFFPPIVAVLLPFRSKRPSYFPPLGEPQEIEDDGVAWQQEQAGTSFRVQRLVGENGKLHPANVGKLWWNKTEAQLVVLDGQHRAMALLAIERTMTNSWQNSSGVRFRSFYENQVKQLLAETAHDSLNLNSVEVPVTVCWFPDETGEDAKPHKAARKLFVDVNKEARPPSESRIILLSDAELGNVLARRMLSELRNNTDDSYIPLYAVEYDNPEINTSRPARWSVLTNIHLLKLAVDRCIFGPPKYLQDVRLKFIGRPSTTEQDAFMRKQLNLASLFEDEFTDGGFTYQREKLGNTEFPLGQVDRIAEAFANSWGKAILTVLSKTAPYQAHARALTKLKDDWHVDDTSLSLAHDALFSGVGVFWTLKDSYEHFQERRSRDKRTTKSDVVKAWEALKYREQSFEAFRVQEYLDSGKPQRMKQSKAAYAVFNTHACQLGLLMTLGTMWEIRKQQGPASLAELPAFADTLVAAWNAYFSQDHGKTKDRKLAFNKTEIANPINQIANMDTPQAVYFRYFWMQALATPPAWEHASKWFPDESKVRGKLTQARDFYFKLCIDQQLKALKTSKPGAAESELRKEASSSAKESLRRALRDWFYVSDEDFKSWWNSRHSTDATDDADEMDANEGFQEENFDPNFTDSPATSLDELLDD